jgi:hypothetical protein
MPSFFSNWDPWVTSCELLPTSHNSKVDEGSTVSQILSCRALHFSTQSQAPVEVPSKLKPTHSFAHSKRIHLYKSGISIYDDLNGNAWNHWVPECFYLWRYLYLLLVLNCQIWPQQNQWDFNNKPSPSCAHGQKQLNIDKPTQKEQDELAGSYTLHRVLKCLQPSNPLWKAWQKNYVRVCMQCEVPVRLIRSQISMWIFTVQFEITWLMQSGNFITLDFKRTWERSTFHIHIHRARANFIHFSPRMILLVECQCTSLSHRLPSFWANPTSHHSRQSVTPHPINAHQILPNHGNGELQDSTSWRSSPFCCWSIDLNFIVHNIGNKLERRPCSG